jgi:hypothetical protein
MAQLKKAGGENPVRTAVRFPLALAVCLETPQGPIQAMTVNVSASGALFVAERLPQVGSRVVFTIAMPGVVMGSDHDVCVHCIGRIVRHRDLGATMEAAAEIDEYFLKV